MKIGIVCYPSIGGSGIVATELGKSLSRRGHQVHFFSYDIPHKLEGADEQFHFEYVDVPLYPLFRFPPYTLALASTIYQTCKEQQLDILHVHYAVPHSTSAFLAKQMLCSRAESHLRVITTLHGTDTELVGLWPSYKPVVEFSIDSSDIVTAVSGHLKRSTLSQFDIHREIRVIYNPIDTEKYSPLPQEENESNCEKVIVHISNFRPVKRINDVVKVFDLIHSAMPARLVFIGEGPDRSTAEMQISRLGLTDRVTFLGPQEDVTQTLRRADLLLSTSESESFGLTIAEAMSCEVPVVASSVGGVPEVIEDGVTGYLAPVGCIRTLAEKAIELLSDPKKQEQFGKAGRKRVLEMFERETITTQYEQLYEEILNTPDDDCPMKQKALGVV